MPEIYTPVDMDMLDSAGLYSVQRDLDVLIVSDNNTALRQYLSKKTIQGAVSAESIQDLMAATLINSVYDDEANTISVGGSGGNGDFLLVAGKGHEDYQEIKGVKYHFDDMEELKKAFGEK
jgi:UDP-N-acetylmuramoyl-L-alanyl-D-glutamate--2,6-diaminopimelate ligase